MVKDIQSRFPSLSLSKIYKNMIIVFFGLIFVYQVYHGTSKYILTKCRIIVDSRSYPISAVEYIQQNNITGNLLLPMEWGEYVLWKLYPDCRVSIDGRFRTVYPETVIQDHFVADQDDEGWRNLIEKYPADILLAKQTSFFQDLIENGESWVYIYSDPTAIVFLRNDKKNNGVLQRFKSGRFVKPEPPTIYFP